MSSDRMQLRIAAVASSLRQTELFMGAATTDLEAIASTAQSISLEKGEYLFHEGDPSRGFYVVQTGAISVHRVSSIGKEQIIHVFRTGESFAEATLATATGYPAEARALSSSSVLLIPKAEFLAILRKRPELSLRMLASMSQHLRVLVGLVDDLTLKDVETRLANWLVKRCRSPRGTQPEAIELTMTKRVLAAELSTSSETLSRTLAKFRSQKLIAVKGKTVMANNPSRLLALLQRNLGDSPVNFEWESDASAVRSGA